MQINTEEVSKERWFAFLKELFEQKVSNNPRSKEVLQHIGEMTYQFKFTDRHELNYWEEYTGNEIVAHEGVTDSPKLVAVTTSEAYVGVISGEVSTMEAMAEELFDIKGDPAKLMAVANILPFVIEGFGEMQSESRLP